MVATIGTSKGRGVFQRANPHGEQEKTTCPQPPTSSQCSAKDEPRNLDGPTHWSYLFLRDIKVSTFEQQLAELRRQRDGEEGIDERKTRRLRLTDDDGHALYLPHIFVHRSTTHYKARHGVKEKQEVTVSGLVFLQGAANDIQAFLDCNYPRLHLYRVLSGDGRVARIADSRMQPFMRAASTNPERIRIINQMLEEVAKDKPLVRMLSGDFAGVEGHIVRLRGDRHLVFRLESSITVCIGSIHKDEFEVVEGK